jgi:acyl carrier protein phosphodiesterase
MNFLAHLYLSGENEEIITGNFIADHVKGDSVVKYAPGIQSGIRLHREIDVFTDAHPVFLKSRERLTENYRKYSGVVTDMFYDHFLSANWKSYSNENLDDFTERMHGIIIKRFYILPEKSKLFIAYMKKFNWFAGYGTFEGLGRALNGMAIRTPFKSGMENGVSDLRRDYDLYKEEFFEFFPDLIEFTNQRKKAIHLFDSIQ